MRSKLFVPGSRPELFDKAFRSEADAISIDLEDAVVEARKSEARRTVGQWLEQHAQHAALPSTHRPLLIVRVNAIDTPHFVQDVASVVRPGLDILNLPKPESVEAVREAAHAIAQAEKANQVRTPIRILLNIESPQALRQAAALAHVDPRVMGLQVGLGDLFEPLGIDRREVAAVQQVLLAVRLAAGEAGVNAYDGAFANVSDTQGYLAEAQLARRLGFSGKSCIHPSQIALANQTFRPSDAEIAHAMNVLQSSTRYDALGQGAYLVDGHMIDAPFLRRAQSIVAVARRLNLLPPV